MLDFHNIGLYFGPVPLPQRWVYYYIVSIHSKLVYIEERSERCFHTFSISAAVVSHHARPTVAFG